MADATGLAVHVSLSPPGTNKWNEIEHRPVWHVTQNWRSRPLVSHAVIVTLIRATTIKACPPVHPALDRATPPSDIKVTRAEPAATHIGQHDFNGEWTDIIRPATATE